MKMEIKKIIYLIIIAIILSISNKVWAAPYRYYPKKYHISINNIDKNQIEKIEVLHSTEYGFNGSIYGCSTEEADERVKRFTGKDASSIEGYWIESDKLPAGTSVAKYGIVKKANIKINDNNTIISVNNEDLKHRTLYLKIVKKDGNILYSKWISYTSTIDEFSTQEEVKKAQAIEKEIVYFEVDFSQIQNNFDVIRIKNDDTIKDKSNLLNKVSTFVFIIIIIFIGYIIYCKKFKKIEKQNNEVIKQNK